LLGLEYRKRKTMSRDAELFALIQYSLQLGKAIRFLQEAAKHGPVVAGKAICAAHGDEYRRMSRAARGTLFLRIHR